MIVLNMLLKDSSIKTVNKNYQFSRKVFVLHFTKDTKKLI